MLRQTELQVSKGNIWNKSTNVLLELVNVVRLFWLFVSLLISFFFLLVWFGLVLFLLQYKTWVNNHEKRFSFDLGIVSHNHDINKGNKDIIWSVNERMQTWYSAANSWESYRIGTKKNPFDIIPINRTEVTQNRFVPS